MKEEIEAILNRVVPNAFTKVEEGQWPMSGTIIKILIAANDHEIHRVRDQYPQCVSLALTLDSLTLEPQIFCGQGGQSIYLVPNKEDSKEKYLAMAGIRIPFRKPKPNKENVLKAIERFAERWLKILRENRERLFFNKEVDYDLLLN